MSEKRRGGAWREEFFQRVGTVMAGRRACPTDRSDTEGELIASLTPAPKPGGCPMPRERRGSISALSYWVQAGCA